MENLHPCRLQSTAYFLVTTSGRQLAEHSPEGHDSYMCLCHVQAMLLPKEAHEG